MLALLLLSKRVAAALSVKEGLSESAGASRPFAERANAVAVAAENKRIMVELEASDKIRRLRLPLAATDTICHGGVGLTPPRFQND